MRDLPDQIVELEAEIERLSESVEQCRKITIAAKVVAATGALLFLAILSGLFRSEPSAFLVAVSALLGGIVLFGSNESTLDQTTAAIKKCEQRRSQLIDQMELPTVEVS